ncbi:MAG: polysaccharide biosynthesis protein, partial [Aggregatilineales bacterium]
VLSAAANAQGGEIYVLKMGAMKITDLARVMVREIAPLFGKNPDDIEIKIVGPRPGEKFHESLITSEELRRTVDFDTMYKIYPEGQLPEDAVIDGDFAVSTEDAVMMTDDEIVALLNRINYLNEDQLRHVVRRRVITP